MKTQIDKFIKLSNDVRNYLTENGIYKYGWHEYTPNINCYRSSTVDLVAYCVQFGSSTITGVSIPSYSNKIEIDRRYTAETLEKLYNTVFAEFEDFKLNESERMKAELEAQKASRIEALKKELEELTK